MVFKDLGKFKKMEVPFYRPGKFGKNGIFGPQSWKVWEYHDNGQQIICSRKIKNQQLADQAMDDENPELISVETTCRHTPLTDTNFM